MHTKPHQANPLQKRLHRHMHVCAHPHIYSIGKKHLHLPSLPLVLTGARSTLHYNTPFSPIYSHPVSNPNLSANLKVAL
jgi:hypothetical protein